MGVNETSNKVLFQFFGEEGFSYWKKLAKIENGTELIGQLLLVKVNGLVMPGDSVKYTTEQWQEIRGTICKNCGEAKIALSNTGKKLCSGKKISKSYLEMELAMAEKTQKSSLVVFSIQLSGVPAQKFLASALDKPGQTSSLLAYLAFEQLEPLAGMDSFLKTLCSYLNKNFKLGSVFIKEMPKINKKNQIPSELRSVYSGCTAILNKALNPNLSDSF